MLVDYSHMNWADPLDADTVNVTEADVTVIRELEKRCWFSTIDPTVLVQN